ENPAIAVELVEHDEPEPLEKSRPLGVVGKDRRAQHVWIGHDDRARVSSRAASVAGRVAVVDHARNSEVRGGQELAQARLLVARKGLGGKDVESAGRLVAREGFENRQVKAQAFAAG